MSFSVVDKVDIESYISFATLFRKKSEFMRHVKSHLRQKGVSEDEAKMSLWYYCDKCGKKFHAEYYLEKHIREVHEGAFTPATWEEEHVPVSHVTFEHDFSFCPSVRLSYSEC